MWTKIAQNHLNCLCLVCRYFNLHHSHKTAFTISHAISILTNPSRGIVSKMVGKHLLLLLLYILKIDKYCLGTHKAVMLVPYSIDYKFVESIALINWILFITDNIKRVSHMYVITFSSLSYQFCKKKEIWFHGHYYIVIKSNKVIRFKYVVVQKYY